MGKLGNFWQIGKLGQLWEKCVGMWKGGGRKCGKMCWERSGEVCLGCGEQCGKCVGRGVGSVLGEVWGEWESMGRCGKCGVGVWKCVKGVGRCVWVWEMCWGRGNVREVGVQGNVGRSVVKCVRLWGSVLGWRIVGEMWREVKERCGVGVFIFGSYWKS